MIAILFEVWPKDNESKQAYLDVAAGLRTQLNEIEGFISIERFESLSEPGKLLSLSIFRDETAVEAWRQLEKHRAAQTFGREKAFRDYRLRVASVIRDYGMFEREQAPSDSRLLHG